MLHHGRKRHCGRCKRPDIKGSTLNDSTYMSRIGISIEKETRLGDCQELGQRGNGE